MSVHLVTPTGDYDTSHHAAYLRLLHLATYDTSVIPLVLHTGTRRGIGEALTEALLMAGRAQPVINKQSRMAQRAEAARVAVAVRASRQDITVFAADRLEPIDVMLFARAAALANVDLWLIPETYTRPAVAVAMRDAQPSTVTLASAVDAFTGRAGAGGRASALPCEAALPIGSGPSASMGCAAHDDAAGCVLASFGHALATARMNPTSVRARLHELTRILPDQRRWAVLAAARDPYGFAHAAAAQLPISGNERRKLRLRQLSDDASRILLPDRCVLVPPHLRGVLTAHRDIRLAEGSAGSARLLIPTDDHTSRYWSRPIRVTAEAAAASA